MPVTIIGDKIAQEGRQFEYHGKVDACYTCDLQKVCHQLDEGAWYEITDVRDVTHPEEACGVFDGQVRVVEAEKVPPVASIPETATRGTGTEWSHIECEHPCRFKRFCQADALEDGQPVEIVDVEGDAEPCAKGLDLVLARLRPR